MGDVFDRVATPPTGDVFDKVAPQQQQGPMFAAPPGTPTVPKPQAQEMHPANLITGGRAIELTGLPAELGDMANDVVKSAAKISTPGMVASLIKSRFPGALPPSIESRALSPQEFINQSATNTLTMMAGGVDAGEPTPGSVKPAPEVVPAPQSGPSVGSILARHIPVVGKYLRTMDDIQALLGKDAPHPTSATSVAAPKPAPVPETNGIQWGSGGQGPLDLRGKMIPDQPSPYQVVPLSGPKVPAAQGAKPNLPEMQPSQSTTIVQHGYDPAKQQMFVQFKNGNLYRYSGVPQKVFDSYNESESQGSFHSSNIKGRYKTDLVGRVAPTPGQQVKQALGGQQ